MKDGIKTPGISPQPATCARGVALVAVLSVLTVLAVLAASFAVLIQLDVSNANSQVEIQRLELLVESGMHHAVAVLQQAQASGERISTLPRGSLRQAFGEFTTGTEPHDVRAARDVAAGRWIEVKNSQGLVEGRYRVAVEDEAAKVNLNTSFLMDKSRGSGWLPGEVALTYASGLPSQVMERVVHYRYGPNRVPGARGDDDANNVLLMSDGIDNNGNGLVDEEDEGVDDPGEYSPYFPKGDDRRITGLSEALSVLLGGPLKLTIESRRLIQREIPRRTTLYSVDLPGSATLPDEEPADVNVVNARQARKLIGQANMRKPFGGTQRDLDQLAVNLADYRDQNHVLSTIGSQYGVEAINFNELLANDGTVARNTSPGIYGGVDPNRDDFVVPSYDVLVNAGVAGEVGHDWRTYNDNFSSLADGCAWDVEVDGTRVELYGPAKEFDPNDGRVLREHIMSSTRKRGFDAYVENRNAGSYPSRRVRRSMGAHVTTYTAFRWPPNFFQNCYICVAFSNSNAYRSGIVNVQTRKIASSTADGELRVQGEPFTKSERKLARAIIGTWRGPSGPEGAWPRMPLMITVQKLQPNVYYLPVVNNWSNHRQLDKVANAGFAPWSKLLNDDRRPKDHKLYYGGDTSQEYEPVRSTRRGTLDVFYISGHNAKYDPVVLQYSGWCAPWGLTFVRPEVIELINVSARPISLRGWTLTFNTGSVVNDIGVIDYGKGYELSRGNPDPNPVIMPNNYFYLVNNIKLFNAEFGSKQPSHSWGNTASQTVPVWEIPNSSWGVQYEIDRAESFSQGGGVYDVRVFVKGAESFRRDQFKGEVVEFLNTIEPEGRRGCANGCRYVVTGNGSRSFDIDVNATYSIAHQHYEPRGFRGESPGVNRIMLLGMPAKGGIVSMTLKNEYKQVVARTVTYAYLDRNPDEWYGQSAEKTDPTHYNWIVRRTPSISGRPELAANYAVRGKSRRPVEVKDGPYVSVGELQRVRIGRDFENVGDGRSGVRQRETLAGLASAFGASALRLEACDEHAERSGSSWQPAIYSVSGARQGSISANSANWEINMWRNHTVRFMTGKLRGEMFPVFGNTRNTLQLNDPAVRTVVRSSPGRKALTPAIGDIFTVGPGYASGLCYTRRANTSGEWTWRQRISKPGSYHLYIFGLSDSISTTEFLEENDNAALDIEVWNFEKNEYDMLARNAKYGKDDGIYAGRISPAHVSATGDFKLRLTARGVSERGLIDNEQTQGVVVQRRRQSGFAWFNYAMLTPVPVPGRVNANTASPRLLASLPGINSTLANDIYNGVDMGGKAVLKPYTSLGDLLNVRGMTPEIFERSANLFCLDSSAYTIDIHAQTVKDTNGDGKYDEKTEPVQGERRKRLVVRTGVGPLAARSVDILEQYIP